MIDRGEIGFVPKTWLDDLRDWLSIESRPSYVIDSTARKILDTHKERLNLSTELTSKLESDVLSPFVQYAQEFSNRSRGEKILSASTRQKLRQFQRTLGVMDKQAEAIEQSITEQLRRSPSRNSEQPDRNPKTNSSKISPKTGLIAGGLITFSFLSAFLIASRINPFGMAINQANHPLPSSTSVESFSTPLSSIPSKNIEGSFSPDTTPSTRIYTTPLPSSINTNKYDAEKLINQSEKNMLDNDFWSAIKRLQEAVKLDSSSPKTFFLLGEAYRAEGDQQLKEQNPQRAFDNYQEANVAYKQAINLNPGEPSFYVGQGFANLRSADSYLALRQPKIVLEPYWNEALKNFREAIKLNENYADAYFGLGNVFSRQGNSDLACPKLKMAKQIYSDQGNDAQVNKVKNLQSELKCP